MCTLTAGPLDIPRTRCVGACSCSCITQHTVTVTPPHSRRPENSTMKSTAAALSLASIASLLLPDSVTAFFQPGASTTARILDSTKYAARTRSTIGSNRRSRRSAAAGEIVRMAVDGSAPERSALALDETSDGLPRGPAGAIKLTYLESNSWMCQVNGLNLLVDPFFGTLDFGIPLLIQARKKVLSDSDRVTRELAAVTDFLIITQGFDDHCHPSTLKALAGLLDPSVRIVAPPSAAAVLEEFFPASRVTYLLPGQSTVLSGGGRAVEIKATTGANIGPPWQQKENGYIVRPAAAPGGTEKVPDGGTLYFEPHLMFDEAELSKLRADVVIAPVVQQSVGPFPLVCGGAKALDLASTLSASKLATMANADGDFTGPLRKVVTSTGSVEEFLEIAKAKDVTVVVPEPAKSFNIWP